MKQLWMLVGGNGAGKTTFYEQLLRPKGLPFINADILAKELFPDDPEGNSLKAARIAEELRYAELESGNSFCFETVFSHPSKIDFIADAKIKGYRIILVVIHVVTDDLNVARVAQRVVDGGHSVPERNIRERIPRTLANVHSAIPLCDEVHVLDNSLLDMPFLRVFSIKDGAVVVHSTEPLPGWASDLLLGHI